MIRRRTLVVAASLLAWALPGTTVAAHGGADRPATSDLRTRITSIEPQVPGLDVRVADLDGRIEVTWTGDSPLTVLGYEDEPYLRIDGGVVERNVHSPATYLNTDRYAAVSLPTEASATAVPQWDPIADGTSVTWHDHRTHYMSPGTPPQAEGSDQPVVITPRWTIDLQAGDTPVVVTGDLTWYPPPPTWAWLGAAALGGLAVLLALLVTPRWRHHAAVVGLLAGALFAVDSVGYLIRWSPGTGGVAWLLAWPLVALASCAWALRRSSAGSPSAGIAAGGLVLAVIGGFDRLDVLRDAFVDSALPGWLTRVSAATCLAVGGSLVLRYLVWLLPAALVPPPPASAPVVDVHSSSPA